MLTLRTDVLEGGTVRRAEPGLARVLVLTLCRVSYRTPLPLSIFSGSPQGIPQVHSRFVGQEGENGTGLWAPLTPVIKNVDMIRQWHPSRFEMG